MLIIVAVALLAVGLAVGVADAESSGSSVEANSRDRAPDPSRVEIRRHLRDLQRSLEALARRARPGVLGVTVLDLQSGATLRVNADRPFPMMSVFKAPLAAAVLDRVDRGELSLEQPVPIARADLRDGRSAIRANFQGERMTFTVRQLLTDAVSNSDNTAADALVRVVGGPAIVTAFLREHGIERMHVDMDEGGIAAIFAALEGASSPPSGETAEDRGKRLRRGYEAFLADSRNRSTPDAAAMFLRKLWQGELLSRGSTRHLLDLLYAQTTPVRLRAALPAGVRLADKCGTSATVAGLTAAFNDIGILTWPDGHAVIVAAFLTASPASEAERDALFADLARKVTALPIH